MRRPSARRARGRRPRPRPGSPRRSSQPASRSNSASSAASRSTGAPDAMRSDVAVSRSSAASSSRGVSTFSPMPITAQPSCGRASIRIPATLRPSIQTSFGHLIRQVTGATASHASQPRPRPPAAAARAAAAAEPDEHRQRQRAAGGADQVRPCRPRPRSAARPPPPSVRRAGERQLARAVVGRADDVQVHERAAERARAGPRPQGRRIGDIVSDDPASHGQRVGGAAAVHRDRDPARRVLVHDQLARRHVGERAAVTSPRRRPTCTSTARRAEARPPPCPRPRLSCRLPKRSTRRTPPASVPGPPRAPPPRGVTSASGSIGSPASSERRAERELRRHRSEQVAAVEGGRHRLQAERALRSRRPPRRRRRPPAPRATAGRCRGRRAASRRRAQRHRPPLAADAGVDHREQDSGGRNGIAFSQHDAPAGRRSAAGRA